MFVKTTLELPFDVDHVTPAMLDAPAQWLRPLLVEGRAHGRLLRAEAGADLAPRFGRVQLDVDAPAVYEDVTSLPFHTCVDGGEQWATFGNLLAAGWSGRRRTWLVLDTQYGPTTWMSVPDQQLVHRVMVCVTRSLLTGIAAELAERVHDL
jgi:hypothetical protein